MKNLTLFMFLMFSVSLIGQDKVKLLQDISPLMKEDIQINPSPRDAWDVLFQYQMPWGDTLTTAGAETDGNFYYTSSWNDSWFAKFDLQGNFIEKFAVQGAGNIRDLAYDGQYFYGSNVFEKQIFVMDFDNRICVDTIFTDVQTRAIAYNDDLDIFYVNNWSTDIKLINKNGITIDSFPVGTYESYYGFAYDNWSEGGPYLWGFSQDNYATLVQMSLPGGQETGFALDLSYLSLDGSALAGGLFTHESATGNYVVMGGLLQNDVLFGLELGPGTPVPDSCYAATDFHGELIDSTDVLLTWSEPVYNILQEGFGYQSFPPYGWSASTQGTSGWQIYDSAYISWPVPAWDSKFAVVEDLAGHNGCCDDLITPVLFFNPSVDYSLSFDSYYPGDNNHLASINYSLDSGLTWTPLHNLSPVGNWTKLNLDLASISVSDSTEPVMLAFHSDDNGGTGSGWAIDNVLIYSNEVGVNYLGFEVYRNNIKVHNGMLTDTSFLDSEVYSGIHDYYVKTIYPLCYANTSEVSIFVPQGPPPPPPPMPCDPPQNLTADVLANDDIQLNWNSPAFGISDNSILNPESETAPDRKFVQPQAFSRDAWDVQFEYTLANQNGEAGAECDGSYFYTSRWNGDQIYRYDLNGNFIGTIVINGVNSIRDLAYVESTGLTYASNATDQLYVLDLYNEVLVGTLQLPGVARALAYDSDQDGFYYNNWSSEIVLADRISGSMISSFECGSYGSYYGFAYDNWTDDSPYLWGFSQDGASGGATLVQMELPSGNETGFIVDVSMLSTSGGGIAGGLFTQPNIIAGTVTIGGLIQNEVLFGLELGDAELNFFLDGYNVYMDDVLHNASIIEDTSYLVPNPGPGTYSFEVTAVYVDSLGVEVCESDPDGPVEVSIQSDGFILGGNVFANSHKLEAGSVHLFKFEGESIVEDFHTAVNDIGYYFVPDMTEGNYMIHVRPSESSNYYDEYLPTYMGGALHWENVTTKYMNSNSYNNDIDLAEMTEVENGNGSISGFVYEDGPARENPMAEAQVMLFNNSGDCVGLYYTDAQGKFAFDNLGYGNYRLLVEITGKTMNPVALVLNEAEPDKTAINIVVDDDHIYLGMDDELPDGVELMSDIFPNPAAEEASLKISVLEKLDLNIEIYDTRGKLLRVQKFTLNKGQNELNITLDDMEQGLYFVRMDFGGRHTLSKKLLVHK